MDDSAPSLPKKRRLEMCLDWVLPPGSPHAPEWSERRKLLQDATLKGVGLVILATFGSVVADSYRAAEADRVARSTRIEAITDRAENLLLSARVTCWNSFANPTGPHVEQQRGRIDDELFGGLHLLAESTRRKAPLLFKDSNLFKRALDELEQSFDALLRQERSARDMQEGPARRAAQQEFKHAHGRFSRATSRFLDVLDREYLALNRARKTSPWAALGEELSAGF